MRYVEYESGLSDHVNIEKVLRVEMQSMKSDPARPEKPTIVSTFKHIIKNSGLRGLFRGVVPRIGVASWATVCMVGFGDTVRALVATKM